MRLASLAGLRKKRIVCLPDFFLDAVVKLPAWGVARTQMGRIARHGGGNLLIPPVEFKAGGNATNTAFALARLGARVDLIAETDALGRFVLGQMTRGSGLGLDHVRVGSASPTTIALEMGGSNVMLSHSGPVRGFGPERLRRKDRRLLEAADAVVIVNWGQNRRGTELLRAVVPRLAQKGVFVYVDTADPRHRGRDQAALMKERSMWDHVGAWGLNENELRAFSADDNTPLGQLAQDFSRRHGCYVDLHTRTWALSAKGGVATRVRADPSKARRLTGAGDAWNAGNLAGHLLGWPARERLRLAHRVATKYVTGTTGLPPAPADL
ncbi:MAG TPA: carbohydrate kinase family protein [Candidatus Thermoplasmatota archaeon]|nr:carbohydrate kinase family protein [Candidatus Thermoplasmatota archaeon]